MKKIIISILFIISMRNLFSQDLCKYALSTSELNNALLNKPITDDIFNYFQLNEKCNVTDSIRKRLEYLLQWRWSSKEIDDYLERDIIFHKRIYNLEDLSLIASKGNDSIFKVVFDSIKNKIKLKNLNSITYFVNSNIVLGVAYINLKSTIPILKAALNDSLHYNINDVELSLARLGNKKLQFKIINSLYNRKDFNGRVWLENFQYQIASKLLFISSQESIFKINEWLDTSKIVNIHDFGVEVKNRYSKSALDVIWLLKNVILNQEFQILISKVNFENDSGFMDNEIILSSKAWIIKNKGKYIINKKYFGGAVWEFN